MHTYRELKKLILALFHVAQHFTIALVIVRYSSMLADVGSGPKLTQISNCLLPWRRAKLNSYNDKRCTY